MRAMPIRKPLKLMAFAALSLLVVSCSTSRSPQQKSSSGVRAMPGLDINRAHKDGAPWWDVDISRIPDATPTLHQGPYKANPYTVLGKNYFPMNESKNYVASGTASWYGTKFHGQNTANGEVYDLYGMSAAHKTLPLNSLVRVTNLKTGKSTVVRITDRGPFVGDRILDLQRYPISRRRIPLHRHRISSITKMDSVDYRRPTCSGIPTASAIACSQQVLWPRR